MTASETCPCHGEPWYVRPGGKRPGRRECQVKIRDRASGEKVRVAKARYNASEKGRTRQARYRETEKGRAAAERGHERNNPRIVRVGIYYVGMAPTPEQAAELNQQARDHFAGLPRNDERPLSGPPVLSLPPETGAAPATPLVSP